MASRSRPRSRARSRLSLAPVEAVRRRFLNVVGVSVEKRPQWRWRIVNGLGEILRESAASFPTLLSALADGRRILVKLRDEASAVYPSRARPIGAVPGGVATLLRSHASERRR